jgi:NAD-dependent deacetylase
MSSIESLLTAARDLVAESDDVVVLTGAGISAESGVPTFRGVEGLWNSYRPEDLATPEAFARDPVLVWQWYAWRRELISRCHPNAAHLAIAGHARDGERLSVITQNVDGLHAAAAREMTTGTNPQNPPIELHGSIFRARCIRCDLRIEHRVALYVGSADSLPLCDSCGGLLRPDVVWFGESLDPDVLEYAMHAASNADLCLVIGTSAVVYPAAGLAALTREGGGKVVEINPEATPLTRICAISIRASATRAVPMILSSSQVNAGG